MVTRVGHAAAYSSLAPLRHRRGESHFARQARGRVPELVRGATLGLAIVALLQVARIVFRFRGDIARVG
jgi:hypothetical protein